jgi:hypothetical protein
MSECGQRRPRVARRERGRGRWLSCFLCLHRQGEAKRGEARLPRYPITIASWRARGRKRERERGKPGHEYTPTTNPNPARTHTQPSSTSTSIAQLAHPSPSPPIPATAQLPQTALVRPPPLSPATSQPARMTRWLTGSVWWTLEGQCTNHGPVRAVGERGVALDPGESGGLGSGDVGGVTEGRGWSFFGLGWSVLFGWIWLDLVGLDLVGRGVVESSIVL